MNENSTIRPRHTFLISDAFGGFTDPLTSSDPDAQISTDMNGLSWQTTHQRWININGREGIAPHLLRLIVDLHNQKQMLMSGKNKTYTGIFINHAERTQVNEHGAPFVVAETKGNVRIVATPIDILSSIRDQIAQLWLLDNDNNALFAPGEQFRSQYTPNLLPRDHGIQGLHELSLDEIPEPHNGQLKIAFVDGFGNMSAWQPNIEQVQKQLLDKARSGKRTIGVSVNGEAREVVVTTSLEAGKPGALNIYPNGKNIDIVGKWDEGCDVTQKIRKSAYSLFKHPTEGATPVSIEW